MPTVVLILACIVHCQLMAGLNQALGHRVAHRVGANESDRFCRKVFEERDGEDKRVFYRTAAGFVRLFKAEHGSRVLRQVMDDPKEGRAFKDSLRLRMGGTCLGLYGDWPGHLRG